MSSEESRWADEELASLGPSTDWQPDLGRGRALLYRRLDERRARAAGRRRWGWALAAGIATCVCLMATPTTRAFARRCLTACATESGWLRPLLEPGIAGAVPTTADVKPESRKMAPDFTLADATGKPVRLSGLRGKVVVVNFWATWCKPCRAEMPLLEGLQHEYQERGLVVLGISLDEGGWDAVRPYLDANRIDYPVMIADSRVVGLYGGLDAVPATFLIDKQGRIAMSHTGLCQKSEYEADISALLKE